jgi:hypothetical protein
LRLIRRARERSLNSQRPSRPTAASPTLETAVAERAYTAELIGATARELAKRARAAGLTALGLLLEEAAMTAGAEAMAAQRRTDAASS